MSKTYIIETSSTFIHGYAVRMDDDMDPREAAKRLMSEPNPENAVELYQYLASEKFEQCMPTTVDQTVRVFRIKNGYLRDLDDDTIAEKFTVDYTTK